MSSKSKKLQTKSPPTSAKFWYYFHVLEHSAVLMASFTQTHRRFSIFKNLQGSATCIVAACMLYVLGISKWNEDVLNSILILGAHLYETTLRRLKSIYKQSIKPIILNPLEINRNFFIIDDFEVVTKIELLSSDNLDLNEKPVEQLQEILEKYFLNQFEPRILQVIESDRVRKRNRNFTFWQIKKAFFLFNPDDRPFSSLIRFKSFTLFNLSLYDLIVDNNSNNNNNNNTNNNDNDQSLLPFKTIRLYSCTVENAKKMDRSPPDVKDLYELHSEMLITPKIDKKAKTETKITQKFDAFLTKLSPIKSASTPGLTSQKKSMKKGTFKPPFTSSPAGTPPPTPPDEEANLEDLNEPVVLKRSPLRPIVYYERAQGDDYAILCDQQYYNDHYHRTYLLSISLAALIMLNVIKSKLWTPKIISDLLQLGQTIYYQSIINDDLNDKDNAFGLNRVCLYNKQYEPKVSPSLIYGLITPTHNDDEIIDLLDGLLIHFQYNDVGILNGPLIVAIWHEEDYYYMFDSNVNACCLRFDSIQQLVQYYKRSLLTIEDLYSYYFITNWFIVQYDNTDENGDRLQLDDWYHFHLITNQRWILRSRWCQNDRIFPQQSRNQQCVAMATIAIINRYLVSMEEWDQDLMDLILVKGDEYYRQVIEYLKDNGKFHSNLLMVDELIRDLEFSNKQIHLDIDDCCIFGLINDNNYNNIDNNNDNEQQRTIGVGLKQGLTEFFKTNETGIITSQNQSFAVWKHNNDYYYFDSHRRDKHGHIMLCPPDNTINDNDDVDNGKACCIRHLTINSLLQTIITNLNLQKQSIIYNLSNIQVQFVKDLSGEPYEMKLLNFRPVTEHYSILQHPTICLTDNNKILIPTSLIVALSWNLLLSTNKWSEHILSLIVNLAQLIYIRSYNSLPENEDDEGNENNENNDKKDQVNVEDVIKHFQIGLNEIEIKDIQEVSNGLVANSLEDDLVAFFDNCKETEESFLIYQTELLELCLWMDPLNQYYYLFDPYGRNDSGNLYKKDEPDYFTLTQGEGGEDAPLPVSRPDDYVNTNEMDMIDNVEDSESFRKFRKSLDARLKNYALTNDELILDRRTCVLCFDNIIGLVYNLIYNTPSSYYATIEYHLKHVVLENRLKTDGLIPSESKDWYHFKYVKPLHWILRGRFTLNDHLYAIENRGKQAIPTCFILIAFASLYRLEKFTTDTIDSILNYGDRLFTYKLKMKFIELRQELYNLSADTLELMIKQQFQKQKVYLIDDFNHKFCIDQHEIGLEFEYEYYTGDVYLDQIDLQEINNRIFTSLFNALELLFQTKQFGILHCKLQYVVVFKIDEMFYMFDPYARGPDGLPSQYGCACITRFENLDDLVILYRRTLPEIGLNQFYLTIVDSIKIQECKRKYRRTIKLNEWDVVTAMAAGYLNVDLNRPTDQDDDGCFDRTIQYENYKWIIRAQHELHWQNYDSKNINRFSCTIVYIALTMNLLQKTQIWPEFMIDEILDAGIHLYNEIYNSFVFNPWNRQLNIYNVDNRRFKIGLAKVVCQCRLIETTGYVLFGEYELEEEHHIDLINSPPNLRQGLEDFFTDNSHGILQINNLILAIWEEYDDDILDNYKQHPYLYLFDPNLRNEFGLPVVKDGRACCLKFMNLDLLTNHIIELLSIHFKDQNRLPYIITPIDIYIGNVCYTRSLKQQQYDADGVKIDQTPPKVICQNYQRLVMTDEQWKCQYQEEYEQKQRDEKKLANLGRLKFHQILEDVWILRSSEPLQHDYFDLPTTIACLLYFNHSKLITNWTFNELDQIIMIGGMLYYDSALRYIEGDADEQDILEEDTDIVLKHLRLSQMIREIYINDKRYHLVIYVPFNCGHFDFDNVLRRFRKFFEFMDVFLLMINNKWSTIMKYEKYYYYFDPYRRNLSGETAFDGSPIVMKFMKIEGLVDQVLRVFQPYAVEGADWDFRVIDIETEEDEITKE